jgi:ABC-2 type transport system ATP-binding protein
MPDNIAVRDLYVIATEHGVLIRRMNLRRDSLEDIFLRAMVDNPVPIQSQEALPVHVSL